MRTVAARRPLADTAGADARAMCDRLVSLGFERWRAERIVSIAGAYGIKAEVLPGKGLVTVQLTRDGYTITDRAVLL